MKIAPEWAELLKDIGTPTKLKGIKKNRMSNTQAADLGPEGMKAYQATLKKAQNVRCRQKAAVARAVKAAALLEVGEVNRRSMKDVKFVMLQWVGFKKLQTMKIGHLEQQLKVARSGRDKARG